MIDEPRSDQMVADLMVVLAPPYAPDRLRTDIHGIATSTRQRPRWLALIKEPPMRLSHGVAVGSPTLRLASVIALTLAFMLALGAAVVTGASLLPSLAPRVPPPFGPAANGKLVYASDGDIYTTNADGTEVTPIVTGPAMDSGPWFSHDGTRIAFWRGPDDGHLVVADAAGTELAEFAIEQAEGAEFMPGDDEIVVSGTIDGRHGLHVARIDDRTVRPIDVGEITPRGWLAPWPGSDDEVLFTGTHPGTEGLGLYSIGLDGSDARPIGDPVTIDHAVDLAFQGARVAPDGSTIAYWDWEASGGYTNAFMHLRDLTTKEELPVRYGPDHFGVDVAISPDSTMVLYEGFGGAQTGAGPEGHGDEDIQAFLQPLDGSAPARALGPPYANRREGFAFSPDGKHVLLVSNSGPQGAMVTSIIDLATDVVTELPGITQMPDWQRLAAP